MSIKNQLLLALLLTVGGFVGGRYSATKPEETTKVEVVKDKEVINNTKKTITTVKDKDGNEKTVTVIDSTTESKTKEVSKIDTKTKALPKYHVAYMIGIDSNKKQTNGVSVDANLFGPVSLGAYAIDNNNYGIRIGVSF